METFVGDIIRILLDTNVVLTGLSLGIKFRRPDGTVGFWVATIHPTISTIMFYDTDTNDLDMFGVWQLQAYADNGAVRGHGQIVDLIVHEPLTSRLTETTLAPTTLIPTTTP